MEASLQQDLLNIVKCFKEQVNPAFEATNTDITRIKQLITSHPHGRTNIDGGDVLYTLLDYDGLKRHEVKDFSFSINDYIVWKQETLDLLKQRRTPICQLMLDN
jgi:hypothetical protein